MVENRIKKLADTIVLLARKVTRKGSIENCRHTKGLYYMEFGEGYERVGCPDCGADQATVEAA